MNRRTFLMASGAVAAHAATKKAVPRPNIVLILAEDLGAWMCGCYGNQEIRTPNIDALARGGMRFVNSFAATPMDSPSRATMFTGRVPRQHGIYDFLTPSPVADPPQGQLETPASFASEAMISDVLATEGYRCGYLGRWHMGNDEKPGHHFEHAYTVLASAHRNPRVSLNGEVRQEEGYLADLITQQASTFIDKQSSAAPFFLTASYLNPHAPYDGHPDKYYAMYANAKFDTLGWEPAAANAFREKEFLSSIVSNIRKCAAGVTALDDQIAILLKKLTDRGLRDNTLVAFSSTNGFLLGRHGLWSKGEASNPYNMYEEVVQVPMIWSWPGRVPAESYTPELVSLYDVLPSLCEAAAAAVPQRNLYGRSFLPLAAGQKLPKKEPWNNLVFGQMRNTEMARDKRFKLVLRDEGKGPNELYNLASDPHEKVNQFSNSQYITVRDQLSAELAAWRKKTKS